jgi:acetyl/propionyl-CoA carboxylase alpha subunit
MSKLDVTIDGQSYSVELRPQALSGGEGALARELSVLVDGQELRVIVPAVGPGEELEWIIVNGRPYELAIDPELHWLHSGGRRHELVVRDSEARVARPLSRDGRIKAPIPGVVTRVLVEAGATVEPGQPLLILEAMKMENEIRAPRGGTVEQIKVGAGQAVTLGEVLAEIG